jgi:hypothetical protein
MIQEADPGTWVLNAKDQSRIMAACSIFERRYGLSDADTHKIRHVCYDYWRRERGQSVSLSKTRNRLEKIWKKSDELFSMLNDDFISNDGVERAFFEAFILYGQRGTVAKNMLPETHFELKDSVGMIKVLSGIALKEVLPPKKQGKNDKWLNTLSPSESLISDIIQLYHSKNRQKEESILETARKGITHNWEKDIYCGDLFELVNDFWNALDVCVSRENHLLGKKIYDVLGKLESFPATHKCRK